MTPENWEWHKARLEPGRAVVFDLDGVLSDAVTAAVSVLAVIAAVAVAVVLDSV